MKNWVLLLVMTAFLRLNSHAQQDSDSLLAMSARLQEQYTRSLADKADKVNSKLDRQSDKYLDKLCKQEMKMKNKLAKIDSIAAKNIFADGVKKYKEMQNQVKNKSDGLLHKGGQYLPWLDSASTSLKFMDKNPALSQIKGEARQVKDALAKVKALELQFREAGDVKEFIKQRKQYLMEQLGSYNLGSELKKYNQTAYYYSQQVNEYREILDDPDKAEKKVLELLNKVPAFQEFMKKNSILASLFAVPGAGADPTAAQSLAGLQTRTSVQQLIQNQLAAGGPGAQQAFQQSMQEAQSIMSSLKNKIRGFGHGGGEMDMPDYKLNEQKTKSFLKRIEYGANIQSAKSSYYFPASTDIGLSAGYKLNDKNVVGIGLAYKVSWGQDIHHIAVKSSGVGLRSFLDIKVKGNFYASGGFEMNYQPVEPVSIASSVPLNINFPGWTKSGLVGITKKISIKTQYFKNTQVQMLWDFLSYYQLPRTQAFKFRVGYSF